MLSAAKSKEDSLPVQSVCLYACNQWVYADNRADSIDQLLITFSNHLLHEARFVGRSDISERIYRSSPAVTIVTRAVDQPGQVDLGVPKVLCRDSLYTQ